MIFGFVTLAEIGAAVYFIVQTHLLQSLARGDGIGFCVIGKPEALDLLLLILLVLSPVLTVVTLALLHRRKKRDNGGH
jgi:hypothetical protein